MHPWLVRRVTYPVWEWRHGRKVLATLRRLDRTQWLSPEEMEARQVSGLKSIIAHAYEHSRYYREAFRAKGITPRDVRSLADLRFLPILERVVLRDRLADVLTRPRTEDLIKRQTSGSTDDPIVVWAGPETDDAWRAAAFRFMNWWDVDVGDRRITMLSRHRISRRGWLKQFRFGNLLEYPAASLSEAMLSEICVWIRRGGIKALWGYPSALVRLAEYMMATGPSPRVLVIFSTGEVLHTDQRAWLARSFQCPVVDAYGASETGYIAGECPDGSLHIFSENVLLEAEPSTGGDLPGVLLVTDLTNFVTPLIRYRIGDLGITGGACTCGRSLPVLTGGVKRMSEQIILPDGRRLDPQMLSRVLEETLGSTRLHQYQVIQQTPSDLEIVLAGHAGPASIAHSVEARILAALQVPLHVSVRFVHQIPPDGTGKQPRFVQRAERSA